MRNLLLITYTFPPDNTAAAIRPGQLYDYLPGLGYQPLVVASSFEGSVSSGEHVWRVPKAHEPAHLKRASNRARAFMRYFAPYDDRLPWIPFAKATAADLVRDGSIDAIFSTSPFLASHLAACQLKAKYGLPWIADFQDPVCDNPFRTRRWVYPYDRLLEYSIFRRADRLVANTDTVAEAWRTRYPQWSEKISILWNSFDPRERLPVTNVPERRHRVLAHVGVLYGGRHPGRILSTFERLDVRASDTCIKLVGPLEPGMLERHKSLFDRLEQKGVLQYSNRLVERTEALKETAQADYLLLLDLNEKNASFQVPSKLLDYVRYGKPILAYTPKDSPVERILAKSGISHATIDPLESESAEERKVSEFLHLAAKPAVATGWFEETFSAETQARTVSELLNGLLSQKKADGGMRAGSR